MARPPGSTVAPNYFLPSLKTLNKMHEIMLSQNSVVKIGVSQGTPVQLSVQQTEQLLENKSSAVPDVFK
jgi:hypothetical protein